MTTRATIDGVSNQTPPTADIGSFLKSEETVPKRNGAFGLSFEQAYGLICTFALFRMKTEVNRRARIDTSDPNKIERAMTSAKVLRTIRDVAHRTGRSLIRLNLCLAVLI